MRDESAGSSPESAEGKRRRLGAQIARMAAFAILPQLGVKARFAFAGIDALAACWGNCFSVSDVEEDPPTRSASSRR